MALLPKYSNFFEAVGLVVFSMTVLKLTWRIINNLGSFFFGLGNVDFKKYGSWAVVTGCTDGIGKAYTEQLAKRGLNIVLISRTQSKLEDLAKELEEKYSIHTKCVAADFTEQTSIYPKIKAALAELNIAVLVNNVGMSYKFPDYLDAVLVDDQFTNSMINCNITSMTKMTGFVLPGMVSRKGGVIINVASASGRIPTPFLTVYSATKAYMDFFSQATSMEYKSKGIIVQSLNPYFVSTKMTGLRGSMMAPKPEKFVSGALGTVGTQPVTNGCLAHNLQGWLLESLPRFVVDRMITNMMLTGRKKGMAKAKRLADAEAKKQ